MNDDLIMQLSEVLKSYQELAEMIPIDSPGFHTIRHVNNHFEKLFFSGFASLLSDD